MSHDTDLTRTIQDIFGGNGAVGLPDEIFAGNIQDADAFPEWEPTDEDLEQMHREWLADQAERELADLLCEFAELYARYVAKLAEIDGISTEQQTYQRVADALGAA
jgi:hypothetical protein